MNVLSIDEAIAHDNYFIRLLAVLDARLGKRRIKALVDNIENEPEGYASGFSSAQGHRKSHN